MLDIRWKNNRKKIGITILVLLVLSLATVAFFPAINRRGQEKLREAQQTPEASGEESADEQLFEVLYKGCYVLYQEETERQTGAETKGSELFIESYPAAEDGKETEEEMKSAVNQFVDERMDAWTAEFEQYRSYIDYCVVGEDGVTSSNTDKDLKGETETDSGIQELVYDYSYSVIFGISFDENGAMNVTSYYSQTAERGDEIIKLLGKIDRKNLLAAEFTANYGDTRTRLRKPKNLQVIFAVPAEGALVDIAGEQMTYEIYWRKQEAYEEAGAKLLFCAALLLLIGLAFFMNSKKIWKENVMTNRPGKCFFMEAAVIGALCVPAMQNSLVELIWQQDYQSFTEIWKAVIRQGGEVIIDLLACACWLFAIYAVWYVSVCFLIPVFSLGMKEYIRQYSFIYQIFPWLKKQWGRFSEEVQHIDFSEKNTKTILKIVLLNFAVLAVLSCLWFWGIFLLVVYSAVLFYLLKRYCDKIGKNYRTLLRGVNRIAEGDLNTVITEDLGVFEPFRSELVKIRNGFKKAVEEEVKSQRMKTELITNVSHDLKTPLTAITTYIELLKKEDITEEERRSYIETLEKKSLRLKVLIEDLFEVSKASSNNIVLNFIELDVVNLMKQVSIEHVEKMQEKGIELRWRVPEEKIIVRLDNQKTYRIFENLFVNVQKYAMSNSRVYVEVETAGKYVKIVLKNMSAEELNFNAEEITERFVRGDSARNTEGSGLGLAIAKSFAEAQGGKFRVEVDGDLFKAILEFPLTHIADENLEKGL